MIVISPIRRRPKRLKYALLALLLLALLSLGGFFLFMGKPVREAQAFLDLLRDGKVEEAYAETAPAFRAGMSAGAFEKFAKDFPFSSLEGVQWRTRRITSLNPAGVTLAGTVTLAGEPLPSSLTLVSQSGAWKVADVRVDVTEETAVKPELPDDGKALDLARGAMAMFARAMAKGDFSELHASLADPWKGQMTTGDLANAFASLAKKKDLDLSPLGTASPFLSGKPKLDEENLLAVQGSYRGTPPIRFDLRYAYRKKGGWKLAGMFVRLEEKKK